jgi:hypothetical protein
MDGRYSRWFRIRRSRLTLTRVYAQSPPKITSVHILDNPFDDIVPRITAEEKRAQQLARESAAREREEAARRKGAKKSVT